MFSEQDYHLTAGYTPLPVRTKTKNPAYRRIFMLSDQGSNLDSSDPESDVLPVTPSDNYVFGSAKVGNFLNIVSEFKEILFPGFM